jgi:hypothetical protein
MEGLFPEAYAVLVRPILAAFAHVTTVTKEADVAEAVYRGTRFHRAASISGRPRHGRVDSIGNEPRAGDRPFMERLTAIEVSDDGVVSRFNDRVALQHL